MRGSGISRAARVTAVMGYFCAICCSPKTEPCPPIGFPTQPAKNQPEQADTHDGTSHQSLQELLNSIEPLECGPNGLERQRSGAALTHLAETLSSRPKWLTPALQRVRSAAESLVSPSSEVHNAPRVSAENGGGTTVTAEKVRDGLAAVQQSLLQQLGPVKYQQSVTKLGNSLAEMQAARDVNDRCQAAIRGFRAATNAVFIGQDGEAPFADGDLHLPEPLTFTSMASGVERARAAVASLGSIGWPHARDRAADALQIFSAMLSAADCQKTLEGKLSNLRFQAERLTQSDALSFGQSRWIKQGLTVTLDALDSLYALSKPAAPATHGQASPSSAGRPWTRSARAAVVNIAPDQLLGLQRAPIQDGFRATLDALTVAAQSVPECQP